jgi:hypothetical protein
VEGRQGDGGNPPPPSQPPRDEDGEDGDEDTCDEEDDLLGDELNEGHDTTGFGQNNSQTPERQNDHKSGGHMSPSAGRRPGTKTCRMEMIKEKNSQNAINRFQALMDMDMIDSDEEMVPTIKKDHIVEASNDAMLDPTPTEVAKIGHMVEASNDAMLDPTPAEVAMRGKKRSTKWGPIQATKQSARITHDGKKMVDKAVELLQQKNLEVPGKGKTLKHSFATICNSALADKAIKIGVSLGDSIDKVSDNIGKIKNVETGRMDKLFDTQPEIFLPSEIDLTLEDIIENAEMDTSTEDIEKNLADGDKSSDEGDSLESGLYSRRSGKGRNKSNKKKNYRDREYMEY